jgi:hypothetical protein
VLALVALCLDLIWRLVPFGGSLMGKLFLATKENTKLKQEVAHLTSRLERTVLSEKIIEEDLSRVKESGTKSTYKLGVGFERCEDKGEKSAPKFISSSTYHKKEATINSTKTHYPSNPKPSFNPKREVRKETPKLREEAFVCTLSRAWTEAWRTRGSWISVVHDT